MSRPTRGLLPTRTELVDAAFTAALLVLALIGFRPAYGGWDFLALGGLGIAVGLVLAHFTSRTRQPVLLVGALSVVAALLLGGVVLDDTAVAGVLPSAETVTGLATVVVRGWKELLTTVRPVGDAGHLLALPYLLGLVAAVTAHSLAQRVRPLATPLLPCLGVAALSILLGEAEPAAAFLQGCLLAAVGLAWMALRRGRDRLSLVRSNQRFYRPVAALAVLGVAVGGAWVLGPALPLAGANERTVLTVPPPFDPGAYASPLSAFRRYTKNATTSLVDTPLFRVEGLGEDRTVRIATLDDYDGLVWGASNRPAVASPVPGFARVGTDLPEQGAGPVREVTVTVAEGYAGEVWVPTTGVPQRLRFSGPRAADLATSLRYSLATATGIVSVGLQPGDAVHVASRPVPSLSAEELVQAQPDGAPTLDPLAVEPVRATATEFAGTAVTALERVVEIGKKLREGAYSDGLDAVPSDPGHGAGRLATFVQGAQIVGNDEQYSAAMALMANAVGVPARVVLYGTAAPDGTITGKDVQAGVELSLAGHGWVPLATSLYTPSRDKKPEVQPKQQLPEVPPKVVPPPLPPLTSTSTSTTEADTSAGRRTDRPKGVLGLPGPVVTALRWGGPPVALLLAFAGAVAGLKVLRRRRRRTRGPATARLVNGWTEVLDALRDLGVARPPAGTRREQARALGLPAVSPFAARVDAAVFGPQDVLERDVDVLWEDVESTRRALVADLSRVQRVRVALSLRSLLPEPRTSAPGATS